MFLLAAAALASSAAQDGPRQPVRPLVQAVATVRIVSGMRLHLNGQANPQAPAPREYVIRSENGPQPAQLIEFE